MFREPIKVEKNCILNDTAGLDPSPPFLSLFTPYFCKLLTSFSELWKIINIFTLEQVKILRIFSQILLW